MTRLASFLTLLATVAAHGVRHGGKSHHRHEKGGKYPAFDTWMETQGKEYKSFEEYKFRNRIYERNVETIANHNAAGLSWNMTVNKFADLTGAEFTSRFTGLAITPKKVIDVEYDFKISEDIPVSIDWEALGAVTPVKNQEQCGSCWAFSTTGSVEGAWFIAKKQLVSLSEQQLIDCSTAQGNNGCNGGLMDYAFQYIISNGGITSEAQYPYTATGPNTCMAANTTVVATISSYQDVPINSDTALMSAIAQQPISIAIEADQSVFQFYSGGVMSATTCGTQLDHGVLAVGYGTLNGADYYKVKNSWGADWGLNGYILLGRGSAFAPNGQCGILMAPSFPLV
jgi:C1A family cysteine protease